MTDARIRIAYDGEALRAGAMDVRDLAPALLALSDLFDESNKVLHGRESAIELRVQSDIRAGSFDIGLQIVQPFVKQVLDLFAGNTGSGLANLIEILGFSIAKGTAGVWGLLRLVKWLRGRHVKRVVLLTDGNARLVLEGDEIVISRHVAALFNDLAVRKSLSKVLDPLRREGVDSFEARGEDGTVIERVTREDLPYFSAPEPAPQIPERLLHHEFDQAFTLVSVTFREGNKWRVSDGQNTIGVTMADEAFLARINSQEATFAKDDTIVCRVRQDQAIGPGGLKTESTILRVLDHKRAMRQTVLPFQEPGSDDDPSMP